MTYDPNGVDAAVSRGLVSVNSMRRELSLLPQVPRPAVNPDKVQEWLVRYHLETQEGGDCRAHLLILLSGGFESRLPASIGASPDLAGVPREHVGHVQ